MAACGEELSKYNTLKDNDYTYPDWAPKLGLLITGSSIICIPAYAIYHLAFKTSGSIHEVSIFFKLPASTNLLNLQCNED